MKQVLLFSFYKRKKLMYKKITNLLPQVTQLVEPELKVHVVQVQNHYSILPPPEGPTSNSPFQETLYQGTRDDPEPLEIKLSMFVHTSRERCRYLTKFSKNNIL